MLSESINNVCVCCLDVLIFCFHQMWCGRAIVEKHCFDYFLYIEELIDRKQDPKAKTDIETQIWLLKSIAICKCIFTKGCEEILEKFQRIPGFVRVDELGYISIVC